MPKAKKGQKIRVSRRGVLQRISRELKKEGRFFRAARGYAENPLRGYMWNSEHWGYGVIDASANFLVGVFDDPEDYARTLGVLAEFEELEEER